MSHRGPKSQRAGRKKIGEDATTETFEADGNDPAIQAIAHGLFDTMMGAAVKFNITPEAQILATGMAIAMLTKQHGAVEGDVLRVVSKCIRGCHVVSMGARGSA